MEGVSPHSKTQLSLPSSLAEPPVRARHLSQDLPCGVAWARLSETTPTVPWVQGRGSLGLEEGWEDPQAGLQRWRPPAPLRRRPTSEPGAQPHQTNSLVLSSLRVPSQGPQGKQGREPRPGPPHALPSQDFTHGASVSPSTKWEGRRSHCPPPAVRWERPQGDER